MIALSGCGCLEAAATVAANAVSRMARCRGVLLLPAGLLLDTISGLEALDDLGLAALQVSFHGLPGGVVVGVLGHCGFLLLGGRRIGG